MATTDVVELLLAVLVLRGIGGADPESPAPFVTGHELHHGIGAQVLAHPGCLRPAHDVVAQHVSRREGGNGLAEVLLEAVVTEFQAFLGAVRPKVAVHAAVNRHPVLVEAGPPRVVPQAPPVGLLLEADELRNVLALVPGPGEGAQLGEAAGSGPDDGNAGHGLLLNRLRLFAAATRRVARVS